MKKSIESRVHQFKMQIRKQSIQKYKEQRRKALIQNLMSINQLASKFGLTEKQDYGDYAYEEILELKKEQLLQAFVGEDIIQDENQSKFKIAIEDHIQFWKQYSEEVEAGKVEISNILVDFMMEFINANPQKVIHYHVHYELYILNMIQAISESLTESQKSKVLEWVTGTEALRLIAACMLKQFLPCNYFPNVYIIIQLGFESHLKRQTFQAAFTLSRILYEADWDDTYSIFEKCYKIVNGLLNKTKLYCLDEDVSQLANCLIHLLDCYDQTLFYYARDGLGLVAAKMIVSKIQVNVLKGMDIMRVISEIDKKTVVEFLLLDSDIGETGMWEIIGAKEDLRKHQKIAVRINYFRILRNLFCNGEHQQIIAVCDKFNIQDQDIFFVFEDALLTENQPLIIQSILDCIKICLFYGEHLKEKDDPNAILVAISQKKILQIIEENEGHEDARVGNLSRDILHSIRCMGEKSQHSTQD